MDSTKILCIAALVAALVACGDDGQDNAPPTNPTPDAGVPSDTGDMPDADPSDAGDAVDEPPEDPFVETEPFDPPDCTSDKRPVVVAHGFLASCDTYALHAMRFASNGYCLDQIHAFDWNTLDRDDDPTVLLDAFIDTILAASNATQVDLAGHSAGGGLGYDFLADPTRAAKVAHYAHIASSPAEALPGPADSPVPTLNLWSESDLIVPGADIPEATNLMLTDEDHYAVATSEASFEAIFAFFNDGEAPTVTDIQASAPLYVSGRAVTLGENAPMAQARVEVFEVEAETGRRAGAAIAGFIADDGGYWGPVEVQPDTHYEFRVESPDPDSVPIHYYREPFVRPNPFVYLRGLPSPGSLAGALLAILPFEAETSLVIIFMASRALLSGTDSMTINGLELANDALASPDQTTIALFLYDSDGDGETSGEAVRAFGSFPFLNAVDAHFPADPEAGTITVDLNGRTLNMPAWPSASEGATIAVFD